VGITHAVMRLVVQRSLYIIAWYLMVCIGSVDAQDTIILSFGMNQSVND
jgi:hypothetical protein